jgi:anti-anti-sigma factor
MQDETREKIVIESRMGFIWVVLPENLNIGNYSGIEDVVMRQLTGEADHLVFDLSRVRAIYSSALGVLIRVRKKVGEAGGIVCLVNVCPSIYTLLESLNLNKVFPIYATDVEFEISEDKAWERKVSERKIEFLFVPQIENNVYRITMAGEMVMGHNMELCRKFVPDPAVKLFVLDMSDLVGMDSTGAGVFMGLLELIKSEGGTARVFGATKIVKQVLRFLGSEEHVTYFKKEKEALAGTVRKKTTG